VVSPFADADILARMVKHAGGRRHAAAARILLRDPRLGRGSVDTDGALRALVETAGLEVKVLGKFDRFGADGLFHAKFWYLASPAQAHLFLGSANLNGTSWHRSAEAGAWLSGHPHDFDEFLQPWRAAWDCAQCSVDFVKTSRPLPDIFGEHLTGKDDAIGMAPGRGSPSPMQPPQAGDTPGFAGAAISSGGDSEVIHEKQEGQATTRDARPSDPSADVAGHEPVSQILNAQETDSLRRLCNGVGGRAQRNNDARRSYLRGVFRSRAQDLISALRGADLKDALRGKTFSSGRFELGRLGAANVDELRRVALRVFVDGWTPFKPGDRPVRGCVVEVFELAYDGGWQDDLGDELEEEEAEGDAIVVDHGESWPLRVLVHDAQPTDATAKDATLEEFQSDAVTRLKQHFEEAKRTEGLLCLPTGGGKTRTALEWIFRSFLAQRKRVLWVAPRLSLLDQLVQDLRRLAWLLQGHRDEFFVSRFDGSHKNVEGDIVLASAASMARAAHAGFPQFGLVCYDEAHHAIACATRRAIERIRGSARSRGGRVPLLGLTATPFRRTEQESANLSKYFGGNPIYVRTFSDLVALDFLARPVFHHQRMQSTQSFQVSNAERVEAQKRGDLTPELLRRLAKHPHRNTEIVEYWHRGSAHFQKTIAFACDIEHAEALTREFKRVGADADVIHSELAREECQRRLEAFRASKAGILINVGMLTEGVDVPDTRTVLLTRPTMSPVLYTQMIGRASRGRRACPGKTHFHVIDCVDNFEKHGLVLAGREVAAELAKDIDAVSMRGDGAQRAAGPREQVAAIDASAWQLRTGLEPVAYTFWGTLTSRRVVGGERVIAVFAETLGLVQDALTTLQSCLEAGQWQSAEDLAHQLDRDGALRASDWRDIVEDSQGTRESPVLAAIAIRPDDLTGVQGAARAVARLGREAAGASEVALLHACREVLEREPGLSEFFHSDRELCKAAQNQGGSVTFADEAPHDLSAQAAAFIALGMALAQADGDVHQEEERTILKAIEGLFPSAAPLDLQALLRWYATQTIAAEPLATQLGGAVDTERRGAILDWLLKIAIADGRFLPEEHAFIKRVGGPLGIPSGDLDRRLDVYVDFDALQAPRISGYNQCASCSTSWPADASFCGDCGARLIGKPSSAVGIGASNA
jgi:superfamily II DNA or RNA helicase/uncharacterized tellurite resistance protein B-like protein